MPGSVLNRPLIKYVAITAAFVGTIQALIWIFLSLIPILLYTKVIDPNTNVSASYQYFLYNLFLASDVTNDDVIVTTKLFNIFMYVYIALSVIWLPTSLYVLWAMIKDKWKDSTSFIGGWAGLTLLISAFDFVVMCLLAADYVTMQDIVNKEIYTQLLNTSQNITDSAVNILETTTTTALESPSTDLSTSGNYEFLTGIVAMDTSDPVTIYDFIQQLINTSYVLVITLAVRGYILWIVNVTFAILLINFAIALSKDAKKSLLPLIDGYSTGHPPWTSNLYEQTDIGNGYSNQAYVGDNDREVFPRSDSFISGEPELKNQNPLSSGTNPYAQQMEKLRPVPTNANVVSPKVAKIGKQSGRRTPPRNVPPPNIPQSNSPYIPDPDYSPPGSPLKPKSVLRPRSNYVL